MSALAALFYADRHAFVNDWRKIVRSPSRLGMWILYALIFAVFLVTRAYGRHRFGGAENTDIARGDYFMSALLATLALSLASGRGAIGIFRSRAEARFVIGSPVAAPIAIAYLQAREALAQGVRILVSFMYLSFVFGPRHLGPVAVITDLLLVLAVVTAAAAVVVPRRLLPPAASVLCAVAGVPLVLLAVAPALRDAVMLSPVPLPPLLVHWVAAIPAWHPGRVLLEPNGLLLLGVVAIAAAAIAILAASGRDAYPELYALSIARIDLIERRQRRLKGAPALESAPRKRARPVLTAPSGVLVIVWKSVVEFRRRTSPSIVAGGAALWLVAGFAAARITASSDDALFSGLFGVIINIMLFVGITATNAISTEVRRPMFWLARSALFERLCALALARAWRMILSLELVAAGFALGGGTSYETSVFAVALPALAALLTGVGFAVFALFPSSGDARGPVGLLRLIGSAVMLAPPFVLFAIGAIGLNSVWIGLGAATLLALIEAGALIGVASWRLDGHVDRLPA